jgi:trans-AT polyketide synthase, acyltransferase and oxidoreductase domains
MANVDDIDVSPEALGNPTFRAEYGLKYAYIAGSMYKGIASKQLVTAMGRAGMMGFLGTGGLDLGEIEDAIRYIQTHLQDGHPYGMNLLSEPGRDETEAKLVDLYLRYGVRCVEASAFIQVSPSLVRYRLAGARRLAGCELQVPNRVIAKVSRPEVAEMFMRPPPPPIVKELVQRGLLDADTAALAHLIPVASDICVEADSGGHTDQGVAYALMPAFLKLRDTIAQEHGCASRIRIGAAGGIGTPEAAAAAFVLGADFILTGSINQCTVEAGTSDAVKDILQTMDVQDTGYAPAGDMFELGAKVQVLKKGLLFPARANKLYDLYMRYKSLDEIDPETQKLIQDKYFKGSFDQVWAETRAYYERTHRRTFNAAVVSPKQKMALIFRSYFVLSTRFALRGELERRADFQIQCGPALGAFNQWIRGSDLEDWRKRHAPDIGERIMRGAAQLLRLYFMRTLTQRDPVELKLAKLSA